MALIYNQDQVEQDLAAYVLNHPAASQDEIKKEQVRLICRETVIAMSLDAFRKTNQDPNKTAEDLEKNLRAGKVRSALKQIAYFTSLNSPEREERLELLETKFFQDPTGELYNRFSSGDTTTLGALETRTLYPVSKCGEAYVRGMFAPKTDGSGMLLDELEGNSYLSIEDLRKKQAESDAISIDIPEGLNESLVTFIVMGEFFKEERLKGLENILYSRGSSGSSIPEGFNVVSSARMSFLENMISNERRINMHACRLLVPETREIVKGLLADNNQEAIRADLKNAFSFLYEEALSTSIIHQNHYLFPARKLGEMLEALKACGIEPDTIGISESQIKTAEIMNKIAGFHLQTENMTRELEEDAKRLYFDPNEPEPTLGEARETAGKLKEIAARWEAIKRVRDTLIKLKTAYEFGGTDFAEEEMKKREITPLELRLLNDTENFLQECRESIEKSYPEGMLEEKLMTRKGRFDLLSAGIKRDVDYNALMPADVYLEKIQPRFLQIIEAYTEGKPEAAGLVRALQGIKEAAASVTAPYTWEKAETLIAPYEKLMAEEVTYWNGLKKNQKDDITNLGFHTDIANLKFIVESFRNMPDRLVLQAAHDTERENLRGAVRDDALKYDHARVRDRLFSYREEHPEATEDELKSTENNLITEEVFRYTRLQVFENLDPNGKDFAAFRKEADRIDRGIGTLTILKDVLRHLTDDRKKEFLQAYERNFLAARSKKELAELDSMMTSLNAHRPDETRSLALSSEDRIFKALFAPVTDRAGILMSGFTHEDNLSGKQIQDFQDQTDAIHVPVPDSLSPALVSFMILGRTVKPDLLKEASKYVFGPGSTLPTGYKAESNVVMSLWDSLMTGDRRANMHCVRSVVPKARQDCLDMIRRNDISGMKSCLKSAFDNLYEQCVIFFDRTKHTWIAPMRKMGELLEELDKKGIEPASIGISEDRIRKYQAMVPAYELSIRGAALRTELQENGYQYFESGFDPAYDPTGDTHARELAEELSAINLSVSTLSKSVNYHNNMFQWMSYSEQDEVKLARNLSEYEQMIADFPEAYEELMRRKALDNLPDESFSSSLSKEKKLVLSLTPVSVHDDLSENALDYERLVMDQKLLSIQDNLNRPLMDQLNGIADTRARMNRFMEVRKSLQGDYSLENLNSLIPYYDDMCKAFKWLDRLNQDQELGDPFVNRLFGVGSDFELRVRAIINEPERIRRHEADVKAFREIIKGPRPAFSARLEELNKAFDTLGSDKKNPEQFEGFRRSLSQLNEKVEALIGENALDAPLMTEEDAKDLRALYQDTLTKVSDYIKDSGETPLKNGSVYLASELQALLSRDLVFFEKLPETNTVTLPDALKARYGAPVSPEDTVARFSVLNEKLETVATRIGGSSEEFTNMKKALQALSSGMPDRKTLLQLTETLLQTADRYVQAKEAVPSTDTGKNRLHIAREIREAAADIREQLNHENYGARKKNTDSYEKNLEVFIGKREKETIGQLKAAVKQKDREKFADYYSELICLHGVKEKVRENGHEAAVFMKSDRMIWAKGQARAAVDQFIRTTDSRMIGQALMSDDAPARLTQLFHGSRNVEKIRKKAEDSVKKADSILTSNRPILQ